MDAQDAVLIAGLLWSVVIAAVAFLLIYSPMRRMLGGNAILRAARPFYARTFFIVMFLAALAPILGTLGSVKSDATTTFMSAVWAVAGKLDSVCWSVGIFLAVYVVVMTVVYAALGRFRDPPDVQPEGR